MSSIDENLNDILNITPEVIEASEISTDSRNADCRS